MSYEKRYTAKQAVQAVLAKTQELLAKSEFLKKSEMLCSEHSLGKTEGVQIVKSEECMKCKANIPKPSPKTGQGEHHSPHGAKMEWQMDKSEMFSDLSGDFAQLEEMFKGEDEGVGSKKIGYKPSKEGENEKEPQKEDKAFQEEGMEHKSSDDPRLNEQKSPSKNPKEEAEGNNELAGTTPTQVGQDGKNIIGYDEIKGHLKLAKFIGRMEHKRGLKKNPAAESMDKGAWSGSYTASPKVKGVGGNETGHEKGVNTVGKLGSHITSQIGNKDSKLASHPSKGQHQQSLGEMKQMPKPKLPR